MRLFIAVNFPPAVRSELGDLVRTLADAGLPVRWTPEDNFHLTLRFLGDRSEEDVEVLRRILLEVAAEAEPFDVGFGPVGAFPSPRRPRVIWISVDAGPRLRLLRDELERRLAAAGFGRDDRSFRPHVTLGRARKDASPGAFRGFVSLAGDLDLDTSVSVDTVHLVRSHRGPDGSRYEPLFEARLGHGALPREADGG